MIKLHAKSHVDHGLTVEQLDYVLEQDAPDNRVTVQTVTLPQALGTVPCALLGPIMGDQPFAEAEVYYAKRGERKGLSRLVDCLPRLVTSLTFVTGPFEGEPCVLYTTFGGPEALKEPFDCKDEDEKLDSFKFWSEHALAQRKE